MSASQPTPPSAGGGYEGQLRVEGTRPLMAAGEAGRGIKAAVCSFCIGILRLARQYGSDRLEAACDRGLDIGARSYGSIQSILKHGLDKRPARAARQDELLPDHPNIRGSRYYH